MLKIIHPENKTGWQAEEASKQTHTDIQIVDHCCLTVSSGKVKSCLWINIICSFSAAKQVEPYKHEWCCTIGPLRTGDSASVSALSIWTRVDSPEFAFKHHSIDSCEWLSLFFFYSEAPFVPNHDLLLPLTPFTCDWSKQLFLEHNTAFSLLMLLTQHVWNILTFQNKHIVRF